MRNYRNGIEQNDNQKNQDILHEEKQITLFTDVSYDLRAQIMIISKSLDELINRFNFLDKHNTLCIDATTGTNCPHNSSELLELLITIKQDIGFLQTMVNKTPEVSSKTFISKSTTVIHEHLDNVELSTSILDQQLLQKVMTTVNQHMHEPDFNVEQLAAIIGIHRTGLNKKLQNIIGQTPILLIRTMRLKKAKQLMETDGSLPISQLAYQVGFNNPKIFSKYFCEEFGCTPTVYLKSLRK